VRLGAVSVDTRKVLLRAADFHIPPRPVARIELPVPYDPSTARFVRQTAAALRRLDLEDAAGPGGRPEDPAGSGGRPGDTVGPEGRPENPAGPGGRPIDTAGATPIGKRGRSRRGAADTRGAGRDGSGGASSHPVAGCPQLRTHLRAADRADRLERERERLERRIRGRSESLARQFDRVLGLLRRRGYVEGWSLTEAGDRLARIYHEADLLVAETLGAGLLDRLDPPSVAALASVFTFEARGPGPGPSAGFDPGGQPGREAGKAPARERGPRSDLQRRWRGVEELARRLADDEAAAGLPPTRPLDPGFAPVARAWAAGDDLSRVIADEEVSGGDFVRNIKQLIDLLRQIEQVASVPDTARAAARAADDLFRDIVAASSVLDAADTTPS
jgi:ATP-dependent RNA helicase HelY